MNDSPPTPSSRLAPTGKDAQILALYDMFEEGEPDISTGRLLQQTADAAHCEVDRVCSALHRHRKVSTP